MHSPIRSQGSPRSVRDDPPIIAGSPLRPRCAGPGGRALFRGLGASSGASSRLALQRLPLVRAPIHVRRRCKSSDWIAHHVDFAIEAFPHGGTASCHVGRARGSGSGPIYRGRGGGGLRRAGGGCCGNGRSRRDTSAGRWRRRGGQSSSGLGLDGSVREPRLRLLPLNGSGRAGHNRYRRGRDVVAGTYRGARAGATCGGGNLHPRLVESLVDLGPKVVQRGNRGLEREPMTQQAVAAGVFNIGLAARTVSNRHKPKYLPPLFRPPGGSS